MVVPGLNSHRGLRVLPWESPFLPVVPLQDSLGIKQISETLLLGSHSCVAVYESALGCLNWNEIL